MINCTKTRLFISNWLSTFHLKLEYYRYTTGTELRYTSSLIHMIYSDLPETLNGDPLLLMVDTSLTAETLGVRGYTGAAVEVPVGMMVVL